MSQSATSTRFLNTSRDGDSTTSLGSLFQCLTTLSVKKFFPNIQSKPTLMQLEVIASCPITSYLGEETNTCLTTTSFQEDEHTTSYSHHACAGYTRRKRNGPHSLKNTLCKWGGCVSVLPCPYKQVCFRKHVRCFSMLNC